MGVDHQLAGARVPKTLPEEAGGHVVEGLCEDVQRGEVGGRGGDGFDEPVLERARAGEEHLALVVEVAEEGALGESGALCDVRDGHLVEAALEVELHGCLLQAAGASGCQRTMRRV